MAYGDVKNQFRAILNRRDLTDSLADQFLGYALQRIQRKLRVPAMERLVEITSPGATVSVPGDYLEMINFYVSSPVGTRLIRTDLQTVLGKQDTVDIPVYYTRVDQNFLIGPTPTGGTVLQMHYYADVSTYEVADDSENWVTEIAPMLWVYCALSYAADYYADDRLKLFEDRAQSLEEQFEMMGDADELSGASISPMYEL